ncbi:MAG: hypothetical protein K0Q91_560 [Fibrobacteria bacterium]|jgi:nitrous oxidase accessory protein|nr:hypothetical protein [Fibrobacteria bacterium]
MRLPHLLPFAAAFLAQASGAESLHVGAGQAYRTVAAALAAAEPGDTLLVTAGLYHESGLVASRQVTLLGEPGAVLDARGGQTILDIRADGVAVIGLTFRNVGVNHLRESGAIWISRVRGVHIEKNRFERAFFGVYGLQAVGAVIRGNRFEGLRSGELSNGNGLHFWKSDSLTITDNHVQGHRDGIYLEFTGNTFVSGNVCEGNARYGLHFMYSNGNSYQRNVFRENGAGVAVMYSDRVDMRDNRFERNWGPASYGLLLKSLRDSRIERNTFSHNTVAVFQEGSSDLVVSGNDFRRNGWALRILADCDRNLFENNRFESNTFDVAYNPSMGNSNIFRRNTWDRYAGWDLDRDGTGDVPHRPVELFPALMLRHPQAASLLRSHFVTLLNALERLFPTLSPASLEDAEPRMPLPRGRASVTRKQT